MAIGWDTRVERAFTFEELRRNTEAALRSLLGQDDGRLMIEAAAVTTSILRSGSTPTIALPAERLMTEHGPDSIAMADVIFFLRRLNAAVVLTVSDAGFPDDPDCGVRCHVGCRRDEVSYVLGIACIIAAARIAASSVWDESCLLSDERVQGSRIPSREASSSSIAT